jgi:holo-[acyl-carrier protein] synthase
MILGLGNDILEIDRIRETIESQGERFLKRVFTEKERVYCTQYADPAPHYAARFSAKEAIVKALGSGFGAHASFLDIEIINDAQGKPEVTFSDKLNERFSHPQVLLTISHCKTLVSTVAIVLKS